MLFLNELEEVLELCRVEQLVQVQATLTYSPITDSSSPILSCPVAWSGPHYHAQIQETLFRLLGSCLGSAHFQVRGLSAPLRRYFNYVCMYVGCGAGAVLLEQRTLVRQRALSEQGAHFPALRIR